MGVASSKKLLESVSIPEDYVDQLVQEFAYDPIRLPLTNDPAQVLYNRRTLENIWDAKHEALNPFTRLPFNISDAIPQAELRQQMCQYVVSNASLHVISDYTKVLSERDMKNLLNQLVSDYKSLINAEKARKRKSQKNHCWKALWQRFNLLRLYCQYRAENRELFSSIRGYKWLYQVITEELFYLCRNYYSSCDDAKEVCKEVARFLDVIGLNDSDLAKAPEDFRWGSVHILSDLATECDYVKVQSMVLRIYRRIFSDSDLGHKKVFCSCTVCVALYMLGGRENVSDISNEDLYNGMEILNAAWLQNKSLCISEFDYVDIIVNVVNLCICRLKDLHDAAIADREKPHYCDELDKNEKNIYLITIALNQGLWLINSILTVTSYEDKEEFFWESKQKLQDLDIVSIIVRLVRLALAGFKYLWASHVEFGLSIVAAHYGGRGDIRRDEVALVFGDFLRSNSVDTYGPLVKVLLQNVLSDIKAV